MMSNTHPDTDLPASGMESLSALFDGELQGDAARFAIKRLGHDAQWRQACGNWQLLGDALRGQSGIVAPRGFAARVAAAVAAEPGLVIAAPGAGAPALLAHATGVPAASIPATGVSRRKWMGGAALAASVAMVAMFIARPFSPDSATTPGSMIPAPTELAVAPQATAVTAADDPVGARQEAGIQGGAAALAVAGLPRGAVERRSRGQSQRAALRATKRSQAAPAMASAATAVAVNRPVSHPADDQPPANPFRPQHAETLSRPWPRAVLPSASANATFTASYGSSASSPSFYPFEPRLPGSPDSAAGSIDADRPRP